MGVGELVVRLVEGEEPTEAEQHDRDDEGVDVPLAPVAEGVLGVGLAARTLATDEQQRLVARVCERVDRLREHRGGVRQQVRDELRDRDTEVRGQSRDDRLGTTVC